MRYALIIWLLVSLFSGFSFGKEPPAHPTYTSDLVSLIEAQERPIPIPYSAESPFPWTFVEGTWIAKWGNFQSYYSMKVIRRRGNIRQLAISQIDPNTCKVVATGQGVEFRSDRRVAAQITYPATKQTYLISIRSYDKDRISNDIRVKPIGGQIVIMSITLLQIDNSTYNVPLEKVTNEVRNYCVPREW